jgi:uncharacterized membrane protein (UPF0127 family)
MRAAGVVVAILLVCAHWPAAGALAQDASPEIVQLTVEAGANTYRFAVEVADDGAERSQGLMFRERLADDAGMLFLYPDERPRTFWMKNTPLPLDIIFIAADGRVVHVAADARPFDETLIPSIEPAQAALEIRGGLAAMLGIGPGALVTWPPREAAPLP